MDIDKPALAEAARHAQSRAYAPYSHYHVGAALLTADGQVITGCNVENAVYPAGICAERVAITKAVSEGIKDFVAIAVSTNNGGTPCGICRQVMREFAPGITIIILDDEHIIAEYTLDDLLPDSFGPESLPNKG